MSGEARTKGLRMLHTLARPEADFRPDQWEAIAAVTAGRRVLLVQATGWGKSAVYLIATRLLRNAGAGPTVIVSPLIALMRNQIEMGQRLGIRTETVNSTNRDEWEAVFARIAAGEVDVLLISPERLDNDQFRRDVLPTLMSRLGLLVVDEVHCISDWGHDFRPDYRRLTRIVGNLPPGVPVLGTTATANDRVVADVEDQLGSDLHTIRGPLARPSLRLQVEVLADRAMRLAWLATAIPRVPGSGIVYCLTVRDAERVAEWLRGLGIDAAAYTGESGSAERLRVEELLTSGRLKVVVATSALGMGYDNPHIGFTFHYQSPGSPIAYYQQVGRAGRAVDTAYGVLLSGTEDMAIQDYFIRTAFPDEDDVQKVVNALAGADGATGASLVQRVNLPSGRITALLKVLAVEGAAYREGGRWYRSAAPWSYPRERVEAVTAHRRREQRAMAEYLTTDRCLMRHLLEQLDDSSARDCGRCANCASTPLRVDPPPSLVQEAVEFLQRQRIAIPPRRWWPYPVDGSRTIATPLEGGRALTRWGDPGLAEEVRAGKYGQGRFSDRLVEALADLIRSWAPDPAPRWIAAIPDAAGEGPVVDFARRLGAALGLPFVDAVRQVRKKEPQKGMQNSAMQYRNVDRAFEAQNVRPEPVLLVDDMVDSRWTLTVVGVALRSAGSGPVYPVALADTSRGDT